LVRFASRQNEHNKNRDPVGAETSPGSPRYKLQEQMLK